MELFLNLAKSETLKAMEFSSKTLIVYAHSRPRPQAHLGVRRQLSGISFLLTGTELGVGGRLVVHTLHTEPGTHVFIFVRLYK